MFFFGCAVRPHANWLQTAPPWTSDYTNVQMSAKFDKLIKDFDKLKGEDLRIIFGRLSAVEDRVFAGDITRKRPMVLGRVKTSVNRCGCT